MIYYGLVDNIKDEHKSGIYGRHPISDVDLLAVFKDHFINQKDWLSIALGGGMFGTIRLGLKILNSLNRPDNKLELIKENFNLNEKSLIFFNEGMNNNYSIINNEDLFYGLFDEFGNNKDSIKTLMTSKGGSKLIILERNKVSTERHFGGKRGKFNTGLYCEHPKDNNILIPLNNSQELIKSFIIEEILNIYEALGAKSILIEDITEQDINLGGKRNIDEVQVDAKAEFNKSIEKVRSKIFGKGSFDSERADSYMKFVPDFPHIMTVVESRKNGNLLSEEFTETINLSADLDINVLELYKFNIGFNSKRKWHFKVEFYDKNDIS